MDNQKVAELRSKIEALLLETGFKGFCGSFLFVHPDGQHDAIVFSQVAGESNPVLQKFLRRQRVTLRQDLLVNSKDKTEREVLEGIFIQITSSGDPVYEVLLTLPESRLKALYCLAIDTFYQPDNMGLDKATKEAAQEVIKQIEPLIEPEEALELKQLAQTMRETLEAGSFGTGILKAGIDEIATEYLGNLRERGVIGGE